jgi:hypothetical protein
MQFSNQRTNFRWLATLRDRKAGIQTKADELVCKRYLTDTVPDAPLFRYL